MKLDDLVRRADELLRLGDEALSTDHPSGGRRWVDSGAFAAFKTSSLSFLVRVFGAEHPYCYEFMKTVDRATPDTTLTGIGILKAVKAELEGGWTQTVKGLVSAEVFSDFLEMADHLLQQDYKDAAAVIIGGVLEEHLRQLAQPNGVETHVEKKDKLVPKKASLLNVELAKAGVYSKLDAKNVTAWLDLRNNAAHGHYDEYTKEQVVNMSQAVTEFMARVSP